MSYESSGAKQNESSDSAFTEQGEVTDKSFGIAPYYATRVKTTSKIDGLGIAGKGAALRDTSFYHQLIDGQLSLAGYQDYRDELTTRSLLSTTKYSPALPYSLMRKDGPTNSRLFAMTVGQTVTQSFTATTTFVDASMTSKVQTSTQHIEFVGMDSVNLDGTQTYTACKFTNTETTTQGKQVTTLWYLLGQAILLKVRTDITNSAGITETTNNTSLVKAEQGGIVNFPTLK